jgi:hypothetical protein
LLHRFASAEHDPEAGSELRGGQGIGSYTLLIWLSAIVAAPKQRLLWTAFFISWAIAAAA